MEAARPRRGPGEGAGRAGGGGAAGLGSGGARAGLCFSLLGGMQGNSLIKTFFYLFIFFLIFLGIFFF